LAEIPARVRRAPYLVEALAPGGGRSGGPLLLAAVGVGVAGNPSLPALAAHLPGGGGGSVAAGVTEEWGNGEPERMAEAIGEFIQGKAARVRGNFSRPFGCRALGGNW